MASAILTVGRVSSGIGVASLCPISTLENYKVATAVRSLVLPKSTQLKSSINSSLSSGKLRQCNPILGKSPRPSSARWSMSTSVETVVSDDKFSGYKATTAFLFPGQGAQFVGMGSEAATVPAAAKLFEKATEILGYDLLDVCINGPKEKLDATSVCQPAIYVASLAAVEALRASEGGEAILASVDVACGLSLGEYTALAFAGALSFEDGLRLVQLRGAAMQAAADASPSAMVSVIGLDASKVQELCDAANADVSEEERVQIANFLCPARMTVRLAVAGAFHTHFMAPAVPQLEAALAVTPIASPRVPVVSNVDAKPHADPEVIKAILAKQVTSPVQWETSLKSLLERGLGDSYELGPGKVIAGILKRIDKTAAPVKNFSV